MAYTRLHWVESETPLSADNMNNIEDGIEELKSQKVDKVSGKALSDQNYTAAEKTKLAGIETGAEVNVQPDWNQSDSSADDFIKNKPGDASTSGAGLMSAADKTKLNGIAAGATADVISTKKLRLSQGVTVFPNATAILPFKGSLISKCAVRDIALRDPSDNKIRELAITGFYYNESTNAIDVIVYNTSSSTIAVSFTKSSVTVITFE